MLPYGTHGHVFASFVVDGAVSASGPLVYSVPQGSVLIGPVLFTLYSQPLSDVISVLQL